MVPVAPTKDNVVGLGTSKVHEPQIRLFPAYSILGGGVAKELIDVGVSILGQRVVPHLELPFVGIVDDAPWLQDQIAFPRPIRFDDGVLRNLARSAEAAPNPLRALDQEVVNEELNPVIQLH